MMEQWNILKGKQTVDHYDVKVKNCDSTVSLCYMTMDSYDGTEENCDLTVNHFPGAVDHCDEV